MSKANPATAPGQPGGPLPRTDAPHASVDVPGASPPMPKAEPIPLRVQVHPRNFSIAEHARGLYRVTAPAGTKIEQVLAPAYWAHVAKMLRVHDLVEVVGETGDFFLVLLVRDVQEMAATVSVLQRHDLEAVDTTANPDDFRYEYTEALKWSVHRKAGNVRVAKMFMSEKDAREWARQNGAKV